MRITHNMMAWNANNNLKAITGKKDKSAEKLSSGYRINRAGDDAAGLSVSEKTRRLIRGLNQGAENVEDGVSWVQTADGVLESTQDILQRMSELSVKAMNGTCSKADKMMLEEEFEHLQSELDRISSTAKFNELNIFEQHRIPYYQCEGDVKWDPKQMHIVTEGKNDLTFTYRVRESDPARSVTIEVPPGEYTTQELVDEIDTLLENFNRNGVTGLLLEYNEEGYCNANLEGGQVLDTVSGNMSYLLYDMFRGGGYGALIGTTAFKYDTSVMNITTGQNDYMKFTIQNLQGAPQEKEITIPQGGYTRQQLIDLLNQQLADTTVRATEYGQGIRLASEDAIVTGFKGNMFKIDSNPNASGIQPIYTSVFYDNVKYGEVVQTSASLVGGYVLPTASKDAEHRYYRIDSSNNQLTLQPTGSDVPVTLTIPDGEYTATTMAQKLNELFNQNQITTLRASAISSGGFEGLQIKNSEKGLDSQINMDVNSSAFETLFVKKEYNAYQTVVSPNNESNDNVEARFTGSKDLSELSLTPLQIDNRNDKFKINVDGTEYTISLTHGTYNSVEAVRAEIDAQLNGVNASGGYKGKIEVALNNGKIQLTGIEGQGIDQTLRALAETGNDGYKDIFQGYTVHKDTQTVSGTSVTLNTKYDPATDSIDPSESQLNINIDGTDYTVTLPTGNPTQDQITDAINQTISGGTQELENRFREVSESGNTTNRNFGTVAKGGENVTPWEDDARGSSTRVEGMVDVQDNEPAVLTIGVKLDNSMVIGDTNNTIRLTLKNQVMDIVLDSGTYDREGLKNHLQDKIDAAFQTGVGGAIVSLSADSNYLVLTARMPLGEDGSTTYIKCGTADSSFLRELNTDRTRAEWTSDYALNSSIVIDDTNNEFKFKYTDNGIERDITLTLTPNQTHSRAGFAQEINDQLALQSITGVTASVNSSGKLCLKTSGVGKEYKIEYATAQGGSSAEVLFGPLTKLDPARITVDLNAQATIKIESGISDQFTIKVNGNWKTVTLEPNTYTNLDDFISMLNQKFTDAGISVKADRNGNKLVYETKDAGSGYSLAMNYDNGGNSMRAIYGVTTTELPKIQATFDADNKLNLTTQKGTSTITVRSDNQGGPFQQHTERTEEVNVSYRNGFHSQKKSTIDGVNLGGNITIDKWNDTLAFKYQGTTYTFKLTQKDYTYATLQSELDTLIKNQIGANQINVTVDANGVKLESVNPGKKYNMTDFSGNFYDKVIGKAEERTELLTPVIKEGTQLIDSAYTVGRKDVAHNITKIQAGISDELTLDLTYGRDEHKLMLKLEEGYYSGERLKEVLQEKMNEQLAQIGLPENLVLVGIGGINTGVYGSNDASALNFSLSQTIQAPDEGKFILDGVSGNAAFEIFYQTDGSLEQAYIMGTKEIGDSLMISPGKDELSFLVDDVAYDIQIPEGSYTAEEFKNTVNDLLLDKQIPLTVQIEQGKVRLTHTKMGPHEIRDVAGTAATTIFFRENGDMQTKPVNYVQMSVETDDRVAIEKPAFNTCMMNINSICISTVKNAEKALNRISEALEMVSTIRSNFGSVQNRLEHSVKSNLNTEENLQDAESKIRDTDMADGMVAFSSHNILAKASQSILAQANQSSEDVMVLLR